MQNQKTISSIRDLFSLLEQSGAILGRTKTHVVLDRQAMPELIDWMIFSRYSLEFDSEDRGASKWIFPGTSTSGGRVFLNISEIENEDDPDMLEFFGSELAELCEIFSGIELVDQGTAEAVAAGLASTRASTENLFREHGAEILEALFNGEIEPEEEETKH